jgi:plasmid maintenance system antidote protein VapI
LAFDGSAESWLVQQAQYDLARARAKAPHLAVRRFVPA